MPVSIKNPETEKLARKLAALTGETITDTVRVSLEQRYARIQRENSGRSMVQDPRALAPRGDSCRLFQCWEASIVFEGRHNESGALGT